MTLPGLQPKQSKQVDDWISDLVGALCDPIIVYPSPWQDDIPEDLKKQIPLERLIMNMKVTHEGKGVPVGDVEALIYMFPRTMEAPLDHQWMQIYTYCFTQAMKFKKVEVPKDLRNDTLSDYDMRQLDDLKRFIWNSRLKARKERARGEKRQATVTASVTTDSKEKPEEKELEVKTAQPSFF